jgi:hypothetical protein
LSAKEGMNSLETHSEHGISSLLGYFNRAQGYSPVSSVFSAGLGSGGRSLFPISHSSIFVCPSKSPFCFKNCDQI